MTGSFKILMHSNSESIHLKLVGDLDNTTTNQIVGAVEKYSKSYSKIFIHTGALEKISKCDLKLFQDHLNEKEVNPAQIFFTGENAEKLAPKGIILK